jgi:hypothetical protein
VARRGFLVKIPWWGVDQVKSRVMGGGWDKLSMKRGNNERGRKKSDTYR